MHNTIEKKLDTSLHLGYNSKDVIRLRILPYSKLYIKEIKINHEVKNVEKDFISGNGFNCRV